MSLLNKSRFFDAKRGRYFIAKEDGFYWGPKIAEPKAASLTPSKSSKPVKSHANSVLVLSGVNTKKASLTDYHKTPLYVTEVTFDPGNALKLANFRFSSDANLARVFHQHTAANLQKQIRRLGALAEVKQADESSLNGFHIMSLEDFVEQKTHTAAKGDETEKSKSKEDKSKPGKEKSKSDTSKNEEFGLGSKNRELSDEEMSDYIDRVKNKEKTPQDKFNYPIVHGTNIHIVDNGGKEYDLEALKKQIMTRPLSLLKKNEKMQHSDATATQFFNVGLPALKGLVVNEKTGKFVIVDTCPGAGICKTYCYAMRGNYVRLPQISMNQARVLNFLVNHPSKFAARLKAEIALATSDVDEGTQVVIRWHDAGDFFSPQYMNLAFDVARAFPEVQFYAYTKVADVAKSNKPDNFVINFSEGALPSETKKVDLTQIKKTTVVPQKMFLDLIVTKGAHTVKNKKGQIQFKSKKSFEEFKDRLVAAYQVPNRDAILIYDDYIEMKKNGELGDQPKWNVVVPVGAGDQAANDPLVLVSFLLWH